MAAVWDDFLLNVSSRAKPISHKHDKTVIQSGEQIVTIYNLVKIVFLMFVF